MNTRATCPYCGVGCGVAAGGAREAATITGDKAHPANFGRLCSKGAALGETLSLEDRLLYPEIDGQRVSWDRALDTVASGFRDIIARHGPDAVAFYVSGQLLTEDYYAANKLIKGFLGTANIDTNSPQVVVTVQQEETNELNSVQLSYTHVHVEAPYSFFFLPFDPVTLKSDAVMRNETN